MSGSRNTLTAFAIWTSALFDLVQDQAGVHHLVPPIAKVVDDLSAEVALTCVTHSPTQIRGVGSGLMPCCGRRGIKVSRLACAGRRDRPLEGNSGQEGVQIQQPLDGETPSGAGEPTCAPRDGRGFHT